MTSPPPDSWDELLQPSITDEPMPRRRPYRVQSAFFVGFFGGPFAALAVHVANARRLRVPDAVWRRVLGEGMVAAVAMVVAGGVVARLADLSELQLLVGLSGVTVHGLLQRHLRSRERHWQMRGVEPARLWVFGLLCVVGGIVVLNVLAALGGVGT